MLLALVGTAKAEQQFLLRATPGAVEEICQQNGLTLMQTLHGGLYLVSAPDWVDPDNLTELVKQHHHVRGFEKNSSSPLAEIKAPAAENSSMRAAVNSLSDNSTVDFYGMPVWSSYSNQPAMGLIGLDYLHQKQVTGGGIVAIIDTGVDPNHPYLRDALVAGYDFTRDIPGGSEMIDLDQSTKPILDSADSRLLDGSAKAILDQSTKPILDQSTKPILDQSTKPILDEYPLPDAFGHGTMVAGLVRRSAPTAKIMPLKAFNADGTALHSNIVRAIYYAVDNGASVINMSFSIGGLSEEINRAINYATRKGVICVASAGNRGLEDLVYPAALANVIGVASTTMADERSDFSNYGADLVLIASPGEGLITTFPGGHAAVSGTSFSTAVVSGAAALLVGEDPDTNQNRVASSLAHAVLLTDELGYGRISLQDALQQHKNSNGQDWPLLEW
jgi:subtilisin family serine protease